MSLIQPCEDTKDALDLFKPQGLYLKPVSRLNISVQLPQLKKSGAKISNWEVMERIKEMSRPIDAFSSFKVAKSSLEFIRFEAEVHNNGFIEQVLSSLDMKTIKLTGFEDLLKVRAAETKQPFPTRNEWDSFFRDNKSMNEMKAGERPDTIHIENLPIKWFVNFQDKSGMASNSQQDKPSDSVVQAVFSAFGDIRAIDIPILDPFREKMKSFQESSSSSTIGTFTFGQDTVFEAYIQYKEYIGFVKAMNSMKNMKLLFRDPFENKSWVSNIKVDFDKTKHLADTSIRKRDAERRKIIEEEKREEEKKRKQYQLEQMKRADQLRRMNEEERRETEAKAERKRQRQARRETREAKRRRKLYGEPSPPPPVNNDEINQISTVNVDSKDGYVNREEGGGADTTADRSTTTTTMDDIVHDDDNDEAINRRIEMEERKLVIAQRKLESIRLLDDIFDRVQNLINTKVISVDDTLVAAAQKEDEEALLSKNNKQKAKSKRHNKGVVNGADHSGVQSSFPPSGGGVGLPTSTVPQEVNGGGGDASWRLTAVDRMKQHSLNKFNECFNTLANNSNYMMYGGGQNWLGGGGGGGFNNYNYGGGFRRPYVHYPKPAPKKKAGEAPGGGIGRNYFGDRFEEGEEKKAGSEEKSEAQQEEQTSSAGGLKWYVPSYPNPYRGRGFGSYRGGRGHYWKNMYGGGGGHDYPHGDYDDNVEYDDNDDKRRRSSKSRRRDRDEERSSTKRKSRKSSRHSGGRSQSTSSRSLDESGGEEGDRDSRSRSPSIDTNRKRKDHRSRRGEVDMMPPSYDGSSRSDSRSAARNYYSRGHNNNRGGAFYPQRFGFRGGARGGGGRGRFQNSRNWPRDRDFPFPGGDSHHRDGYEDEFGGEGGDSEHSRRRNIRGLNDRPKKRRSVSFERDDIQGSKSRSSSSSNKYAKDDVSKRYDSEKSVKKKPERRTEKRKRTKDSNEDDLRLTASTGDESDDDSADDRLSGIKKNKIKEVVESSNNVNSKDEINGNPDHEPSEGVKSVEKASASKPSRSYRNHQRSDEDVEEEVSDHVKENRYESNVRRRRSRSKIGQNASPSSPSSSSRDQGRRSTSGNTHRREREGVIEDSRNHSNKGNAGDDHQRRSRRQDHVEGADRDRSESASRRDSSMNSRRPQKYFGDERDINRPYSPNSSRVDSSSSNKNTQYGDDLRRRNRSGDFHNKNHSSGMASKGYGGEDDEIEDRRRIRTRTRKESESEKDLSYDQLINPHHYQSSTPGATDFVSRSLKRQAPKVKGYHYEEDQKRELQRIKRVKKEEEELSVRRRYNNHQQTDEYATKRRQEDMDDRRRSVNRKGGDRNDDREQDLADTLSRNRRRRRQSESPPPRVERRHPHALNDDDEDSDQDIPVVRSVVRVVNGGDRRTQLAAQNDVDCRQRNRPRPRVESSKPSLRRRNATKQDLSEDEEITPDTTAAAAAAREAALRRTEHDMRKRLIAKHLTATSGGDSSSSSTSSEDSSSSSSSDSDGTSTDQSTTLAKKRKLIEKAKQLKRQISSTTGKNLVA